MADPDLNMNPRHNARVDNPLKIQPDVLDHLRVCEDAITEAIFDWTRFGSLGSVSAATLRLLANTRVTSGPKLQDMLLAPEVAATAKTDTRLDEDVPPPARKDMLTEP